MTNYNDSKHRFRANLEESNEKAASHLILKDFFLIPLKNRTEKPKSNFHQITPYQKYFLFSPNIKAN